MCFLGGEIFPPGIKIYYYLITGMESDSGLHGKGPTKALVRSLGGQGGCGEQRVLSTHDKWSVHMIILIVGITFVAVV